MEDSINAGRRVSRETNQVLHVTCNYTGEDYKPFVTYFPPDQGGGVNHAYPVHVPPNWGTNGPLSLVPEIPSETLQDCLLEAFNTFTTQFPQQMSLPEFIGGFRQLKELLPDIRGDFLQDLARLHLTNEFGWQSLLTDLEALDTVVSKTRDRLEWLRETYGRPSRLAYFKKDVITPDLGAYVDYEPIYAWGTRYQLTSLRSEVRAGATLTQYMSHLDDAIGLMRGLTSAFGLDNPVKAFWELTPFSFAVDYLFNISGHLDRLTRVQPSEPWLLSRMSYSTLIEARFDVIQYNHTEVHGHPKVFQRLGEMKYRRYFRGQGLPVSLATLSPESLSPEQLVLLLAIIGSGSK